MRRIDRLYQPVPVPAGTHTIRFSYSPPNIIFGELAFAAGILLLAFVVVSRRRQAQAS